MTPSLPTPFTARAGADSDLHAVLALQRLFDREAYGAEVHPPTVLRTRWTLPDVDPQQDAIMVQAPDRSLVGYEFVFNAAPFVRPSMSGAVHPEHHRRGIGCFLVHWAERRARQRLPAAPEGARVVLCNWSCSGHPPTATLLEDLGMQVRRHLYLMAREMDTPPERPNWPPNLELRAFKPDEHDLIVFRAMRDSFRDHWGHIERPFDEEYRRWRHRLDRDPNVEPGLWFIAWDGKEVAGICLCWPRADEDPEMGFVNVLGVRRAWRGRGLGLALLLHSFGVFWGRGMRKVGLGVDAGNLTGALRLYRRAGMQVLRVHDFHEKELRPGRELRRESLSE